MHRTSHRVIEAGTDDAGKAAAFFHGSEKFRCIDDNGVAYEIFLTRVTVDSSGHGHPVEVSLTALVCNVKRHAEKEAVPIETGDAHQEWLRSHICGSHCTIHVPDEDA